jgi:hypothetical protein
MNGTTRFASAGMFFAVVAVLACWLSAFPVVGGWPRLWGSFDSPGCPVQAPLGRGFPWTTDELWAGGPACGVRLTLEGAPFKLRLGGSFPE